MPHAGRARPAAVLYPGRDARVRAGHLWVYRNEIARLDGSPADGDAVEVVAGDGRSLGVGLLNTRSLIAVRLLAPTGRPLDEAFFRERLGQAIALRERVVSGTTACRLVFGESDRLPGLIVDRYGDVLVLQTLTLGMDRRKEMLARVLCDLLAPRGVFARNDPAVRRLEGLPRETGWIAGGGVTEVEIDEGGVRFLVDVARGQKTGFFLDQRENRMHVAPLTAGRAVLDCFSYTGAWALHAVHRGAASVLGIEASEEAVAMAGRNAAINAAGERYRVLAGNAFDELRRLSEERAKFDVIVLDPPAFVKTRSALASGLAGYKEINLRALKLAAPGGWLVTCSCSYHVDEAALWATVWEAARDARRWVRLVESRSQGRDHPVHPAMPETRYLKCLIFFVE
ncbi:MAG TPA: class I SAM-dependent rRNA methyltransferase [bacterium]|nr:class I SAM-dependent rRNA methyltransferase [bacterium]